MPEISIDGRRARTPDGTTLLEAARTLGIEIPTLCLLSGHPHHTSCMVCLVEDAKTGRMMPACAVPAVEGQEVFTNSDRVLSARRASLELLLSEHRGDCEAPCSRACPAHADIPGMIRKFLKTDPQAALAAMWKRLPLVGTFAHLCPAPCERACRRRLVDSPVAICGIVREAAKAGMGELERLVHRPSPPTGKNVAVVGAGPAGLSVAYFLAAAGYGCVVLEAEAWAGGILRQETSAGRFPSDILDAEISLIERMGVDFRLGERVSAGSRLAELREHYDAVVLATGSPDSLAALLPEGAAFDRQTGSRADAALPVMFACGNALRSRPTTVAVQHVADARRVARAIGLYLSGFPIEPALPGFDSRRDTLNAEELTALGARTNVHRPRWDTSAGGEKGARLGTSAESAEWAAAEAARCLRCDCARKPSCALRELADRLGARNAQFPGQRSGTVGRLTGAGGLSFEPGKCIKCGICVRIAERGGDRPGLAFSGRGFDIRLCVPFGEDLGRALASTAAECVARCPTGALAWDRGRDT